MTPHWRGSDKLKGEASRNVLLTITEAVANTCVPGHTKLMHSNPSARGMASIESTHPFGCVGRHRPLAKIRKRTHLKKLWRTGYVQTSMIERQAERFRLLLLQWPSKHISHTCACISFRHTHLTPEHRSRRYLHIMSKLEIRGKLHCYTPHLSGKKP